MSSRWYDCISLSQWVRDWNHVLTYSTLSPSQSTVQKMISFILEISSSSILSTLCRSLYKNLLYQWTYSVTLTWQNLRQLVILHGLPSWMWLLYAVSRITQIFRKNLLLDPKVFVIVSRQKLSSLPAAVYMVSLLSSLRTGISLLLYWQSGFVEAIFLLIRHAHQLLTGQQKNIFSLVDGNRAK